MHDYNIFSVITDRINMKMYDVIIIILKSKWMKKCMYVFMQIKLLFSLNIEKVLYKFSDSYFKFYFYKNTQNTL